MVAEDLPFAYEVLLDDEPIKRFRSLREAKWFTEHKDDAKIIKLSVEKKNLLDTYEEAPF